MPRGRWVFNEELSRALWQQMLRGPRPPSVQWPSRRNDMKKNVPSRPQTDRQPGTSGQPRRWRGRDQRQQPVREVKNPDDDAAALQGRIEKLEKAIEVLGADNPEAKGLVSALKKARAQSQSQLAIGVRLDSCRAFVERAKKRLAGAEEAVTKALSLKSAMEAELEQGLARLQSLREEAAAQPSTTIPDPMELPDDEVSRLRARVAELESAQRAEVPTELPTNTATAAEEVNRLRATVEELRRERISWMSEVARRTDVSRGGESTRMATLIDQADEELRATGRFQPY